MCCTMSLIDRNLIKFNLTSQTKSLQPPGVFVDAHDVLYFDKHEKRTWCFLILHSILKSYSVAVFIKHLVSGCSQSRGMTEIQTFQVILDCSEVWLGLLGGRLQSVGGLCIDTAMMQWWASHGEQQAMCHKRRSLLVIIHSVMAAWRLKRSKRCHEMLRWSLTGYVCKRRFF